MQQETYAPPPLPCCSTCQILKPTIPTDVLFKHTKRKSKKELVVKAFQFTLQLKTKRNPIGALSVLNLNHIYLMKHKK